MAEAQENRSDSFCKRRKSKEDSDEVGKEEKEPALPMDTELTNDVSNQSQSETKVERCVVKLSRMTGDDDLPASLDELTRFDSVASEQRVDEEVQEEEQGSVGDNAVPSSPSAQDQESTAAAAVPLRQMRQRARNYRRRSNASSSPESASHHGGESPLSGSVPQIDDIVANINRTGISVEDSPTENSDGEASGSSQHSGSPNLFQERMQEEGRDQLRDWEERLGNEDSASEELDDDDDDDDDNDDDDEDDDHDLMNDEVNAADANEENVTLQEVLGKPKPSYTWNHQLELMRREHGLSRNAHSSLRGSGGFATRFYSSRHVVERMKLSHCLRKHSGCVNCLSFNRQGDLLCTGSDDTRIIVWDWAQSKARHCFKSGHVANIFQTKFIDDSVGCLDIVSTSRDGQVRRSVVPPSGGTKVGSSCLYKHRGAVHKLVVCPQRRAEIITVGEDGYIRCKDLRTESVGAAELTKVVTGTKKNRKVRLFSIAHHPFAPEIVVCGCDNFVRVYDKRNMDKAVHEMCPEHLVDTSIPQVTCCVYNSTGSEVLASYSDDHIYLFDNNNYKAGEFLHRYRGHYNHKTIKGVNFFGPDSEYVISGSDCGNIFFWDKNTESILNFMPGDTMGVVNCLEPHPSIPVLATSGLDHNIKIWTPNSEIYPPDLSKLELCVKRNLRRSVIDEGTLFDDRQFHYFIRQFLRRSDNSRSGGAVGGAGRRSDNENVDANGGDGGGSADGSNDDDSNSSPDMENMWSLPSASSVSSEENEHPQLEGIHCRTQ